MKSRLLLALLLPLALVSVALADDKANQADLEKGTWKVTAMNEAGKEITADMLAQVKLNFTFKGDALTIKSANESKEGTFKIDSSKTPHEIDMKMEKDKPADKGIYEINKDTLKIAIGVPDRPADFKVGAKVVVFTLERQK
jgi:uncharacterized protein (TIGR03067 family)